MSLANSRGGEKGFTLIELFLVLAMLGILATVGIGEIVNHRRQAFDRQTIAKAREWLTVASVAVANQELAAIIGATSQGTPPDFPNVDMNPTIHWSYANAGGDVGSSTWPVRMATPRFTFGYLDPAVQ